MRLEQRLARVKFLSQDDLLQQISLLNPFKVLSVDYNTIMTDEEKREGKSVAVVHYIAVVPKDDL